MTRRNERNTENLVQKTVLAMDEAVGCTVEFQSSAYPPIQKALKDASKSGGSGAGRPEFFVHRFSDPAVKNLVVVYECKADPMKHESEGRNRASEYAVDGAIHYARHLSSRYDVIAVAVSGEKEGELRVSAFKRLKGAEKAEELRDASGPINRLLTFDQLAAAFKFDPEVQLRDRASLLASASDLHHFLRDHVGATEEQKPLIVSGILLALTDDSFHVGYSRKSPSQLPKYLYETLAGVLDDAEMPFKKREAMMQPYSFIPVHPELGKPGVLDEIICRIVEDVWPYREAYSDVDVLGHFYGEFLKYTAGDGKGLGIVLTPKHVTELFAKLANLTPSQSVVLDPCAGTGGFLIAAMAEMFNKADGDLSVIDDIKKNRLYGIEQTPHMFALAASNMILRGDGKANLYRNSCFDDETIGKILNAKTDDGKTNRPNTGFINPPYAMKKDGQHELDFIENMLDMLALGSLGFAIVPMSCAISAPQKVRDSIMSKHRLVAAMSMPDELFYPTGTVTCILVFEAGRPHEQAGTDTWFGYWKDDGFTKTKDKGRVDLDGRWEGIRNEWVNAFKNRDEKPGRSVRRRVRATDEWCAEAYLDTDYSLLTEEDFVSDLRKFALFQATSSEARSLAGVPG